MMPFIISLSPYSWKFPSHFHPTEFSQNLPIFYILKYFASDSIKIIDF